MRTLFFEILWYVLNCRVFSYTSDLRERVRREQQKPKGKPLFPFQSLPLNSKHGTNMTESELKKEISELERAATRVPSRYAGGLLMKVAVLKKELMKLESATKI